MRALFLVTAICAAFCPAKARAHSNTRAHLKVQTSDFRSVSLVLSGSFRDFAPLLNISSNVNPVADLYRTQRKAVLADAAAQITLYDAAGTPCGYQSKQLVIEQKRLRLELVAHCSGNGLELRYDLFYDTDPDHKVFIHRPGAVSPELLTAQRRVLRLQQATSWWRRLGSFVLSGVVHMLSGVDHLLFLFTLLIVLNRRRQTLREVALVVTAFTLGHSMTLVIAALGWLTLPARPVEVVIALSISVAAAEGLRDVTRPAWPTAVIAVLFGLIHGLGFASVLSEAGRAPDLGSLFAFNLGLELAQLAVVAIAYPPLRLTSRRAGFGRVCQVALWLLILLGLAWATIRTLTG